MSLLIDGYNLLHVTGIFGEGPAARSLESSRHALLGFLAKHAVADHTAVTIVFDAKECILFFRTDVNFFSIQSILSHHSRPLSPAVSRNELYIN